jgi:hypothetical protein
MLSPRPIKIYLKNAKSTFCTGTNIGTIIQKLLGTFFEKFRQISLGSQNMKLEGLLFSSAKTFKITKWRQVLP